MQDALLVDALVVVLVFMQSAEHRRVHLLWGHGMLIWVWRGRRVAWGFCFFSLANSLTLLGPEFRRRRSSVVAGLEIEVWSWPL